jgi:hypothetical protein
MTPPKTGLMTGTDIAIVGVAGATTSEIGDVAGSEMKFASPLYVAVAV